MVTKLGLSESGKKTPLRSECGPGVCTSKVQAIGRRFVRKDQTPDATCFWFPPKSPRRGLLDQAQARTPYTPPFGGHLRGIPQAVVSDVKPLVKSSF